MVGVLSDTYLALCQLFIYGPLKDKDILADKQTLPNSFGYGSFVQTTLMHADPKKRENYSHVFDNTASGPNYRLSELRINGLITINKPDLFIQGDTDTVMVDITKAGKDYISTDIQNRKLRVNINSEKLKVILWRLLSEVSDTTPFYRKILETHNVINADSKLTKQAHKFMFKCLPHWLSYTLGNDAWTISTGPNRKLYAENKRADYSNWRETITADFKLVHATPGIGAVLLEKLDAVHRTYAGFLVASESPDEVVAKIVDHQKKDPDSFLFCNT